jgi:hypothetical protein
MMEDAPRYQKPAQPGGPPDTNRAPNRHLPPLVKAIERCFAGIPKAADDFAENNA